MAESVDALVSNTSGFTSIPVRPRVWVRKEKGYLSPFFCLYILSIMEMMLSLRKIKLYFI